jgi:hypothetical protein
MLRGMGMRLSFCTLRGQEGMATSCASAEDGSGVATGGGNSVGVDFSRTSGADALIIVAGPAADGKLEGDTGPKARASTVAAGGTTFAILSLSSSAHPEAKASGDKVAVGGQTISFDGRQIIFAKMAPPPPTAKATAGNAKGKRE